MSVKLLFVDDEVNVLNGIKRTLHAYRSLWEMHFMPGVDEALEALQLLDFDVVISDISMPGKDGFDLLTNIRDLERTRDIPFLMVTGLNDRSLKRKALDLGATDLLNKPVDLEDLVARINSMLRLKSYHDEIKAQNDLLDRKVKERTVDLEAARLDLIWRLGRAAEYRDTDTGNHVIRVGYYCRALADKLGMDLEFRKGIFLTSPLHDIGKIGVPDNILLKQGKLTSDEWRIMRRHCEIGADILRQDPVRWSKVEMCHDLLGLTETVKSDNPFLKMAKTIALTHHERWDGYGYPFGLSEGEIPLESRIVTVADVYDALYSKRPYKPGYTDSKVLEIMRENNGIQFDPGVFACFEKSLDLFDDIRSQFSDQQDGISTEWQDEYRHLLWQVKK